jgi:TRAP-type C4-dicarboxylate transport system permease large subunit
MEDRRFEFNSYVDIWGTRRRKPPSSLYYDMIGLLTPPVGIAVYIASNQAGISVTEGFRKTAPFIIPLVVTPLLITYVPETVLFLPRLLFK